MIRQRTLKNVIRATGIGLHTGKKVYLTLRPAAVDTGIVFRRTDLATGEYPGLAALRDCANAMASVLGWDSNQIEREITEVTSRFPSRIVHQVDRAPDPASAAT